jgi:hypothetical protein
MVSIWNNIQQLVVVFSYKDEKNYRDFRAELDRMLNESSVKMLDIIVTIPKEIKKEDLPPHRLIHFISPKDFNWLGKLKGDLLDSVLSKKYDAIINFGHDVPHFDKVLSNMNVKFHVGVNTSVQNEDIHVQCKGDDMHEMVSFAKQTLEKLSA